jgi:hypothetical protein
MQQPDASGPNVAQPPIPPYNPQDYPPPQTANPYGYPPARGPGDNVSANENLPRQISSPVVGNTATPVPPPANANAASSASAAPATSAPYFPPPPTSPFPDITPDPLDLAEEGALSLLSFSSALSIQYESLLTH